MNTKTNTYLTCELYLFLEFISYLSQIWSKIELEMNLFWFSYVQLMRRQKKF